WFELGVGKADAKPGERAGLIYARLNHPNAEMFETALCAVEKHATRAAAFTSGMAAITTTILTLARPGQRLLYQRPVYGGTDHLFRHLLPDWGIEAIAVAEHRWPEALRENAGRLALVYVETPANPTLR